VSDNSGPLAPSYATEASQNLTITIEPVNQAPSFKINPLVTGSPHPVLMVDEDAWLRGSPFNMTSFITDILRGADIGNGPKGEDWGETYQKVTFTVTGGSVLFAELPTIDENGTLAFSLEPNMCGNATFKVHLRDNGGTERGGVDVSQATTFGINVACVNDPPVFSISCLPDNSQIACNSACVAGDAQSCSVNLTVNQVSASKSTFS
jgi:hypothetical protein